jgi:hypothetical protein
MLTVGPKSNDPSATVQTVGQIAVAVGGVGAVMVIFSLIKEK